MQEYGEKTRDARLGRGKNLASRCGLLALAARAAYAAGAGMLGAMLAVELRCRTAYRHDGAIMRNCRPLKDGPSATMADGGSRGKPPYPSVHRGHQEGEGAHATAREVHEKGQNHGSARGGRTRSARSSAPQRRLRKKRKTGKMVRGMVVELFS